MAKQFITLVAQTRPDDTSYNTLLSNAAASGYEIEIDAITLANTDGSNAVTYSVAVAAVGATTAVTNDIATGGAGLAAATSTTLLSNAGVRIPQGYKLDVKTGTADDIVFTVFYRKVAIGLD